MLEGCNIDGLESGRSTTCTDRIKRALILRYNVLDTRPPSCTATPDRNAIAVVRCLREEPALLKSLVIDTNMRGIQSACLAVKRIQVGASESASTEQQFVTQPTVISGMKFWPSALVGLGIGAVLGYLFGIQRGDLWIGSSIAVTSSIAGYGFFACPQYRFRWSGSHSKLWYSLITVLAPALMLLTPYSTLLSDDLSIVVFIGCLWVGGVNAGVALVHESPNNTDNEAQSTPQSSPGD